MKDERVKVISLEIENIKRVQAVTIAPSPNGLTVIGGKNKQGKSSCLDAICAALGGEKFNPRMPIKDGEKKGVVTVELSNGIVAKRIYTPGGSRLEIAGSDGKGGQTLLNEFISVFALDLSTFLKASDKEKATILLNVIGVDLQPYEEKEKTLYAERENLGRLEKKAKGHAESLPFDEEAGTEMVTADSLMKQLQEVVTHNAENRKLRENLDEAKRNMEQARVAGIAKQERVEELKERLEQAEAEAEAAIAMADDLKLAVTMAEARTENLVDQDEKDIQEKLSEIEKINVKVRGNLDREKAFSEAEGYHTEWMALDDEIKAVRRERLALLNGAKMPLEGLSVDDGVLTYNDKPWDCLSHAEQLIASTAICQKTNDQMGFVLVDKLEAMDLDTLAEYKAWLESEGLQAITTRVSQGGECSLIIEDGQVVGQEKPNLDNPEF